MISVHLFCDICKQEIPQPTNGQSYRQFRVQFFTLDPDEGVVLQADSCAGCSVVAYNDLLERFAEQVRGRQRAQRAQGRLQ